MSFDDEEEEEEEEGDKLALSMKRMIVMRTPKHKQLSSSSHLRLGNL